MAEQRRARLIKAEAIGAETRLLEFAVPEGEPLGFSGGKYIIVNSELTLPDGKVCKRAYSILSSDRHQSSFQIAVRKIGMGSSFMHELPLHSDLLFSGPWGKFIAEESHSSTWILATDTGITAALGLIQATAFKPNLEHTELCWWVRQPDPPASEIGLPKGEAQAYFLPENFVRERVPPECASFRLESAPPIGDPARVEKAQAFVSERLRRGLPDHVYLCGDGAALLPLTATLVEAGLPAQNIHVETFFNHAKRKSA